MPIFKQFILVQLCPVQNQLKRPPWYATFCHFQTFNLNDCLLARIFNVKMRGRVVIKVHAYKNTVKRADNRHGTLLWRPMQEHGKMSGERTLAAPIETLTTESNLDHLCRPDWMFNCAKTQNHQLNERRKLVTHYCSPSLTLASCQKRGAKNITHVVHYNPLRYARNSISQQ